MGKSIYKICRQSVLIAVFLCPEAFHLNCQVVATSKGYGPASYDVSQSGKFMKSWLLAGPIAVAPGSSDPDNASQEKVFKTDVISIVNVVAGRTIPPISVSGKDLNWQLISWKDDIVDLDSIYKHPEFVYAYALSEIKADVAGNAFLAIGSDDGIKVWLNGKLVHDNWAARGVNKDEDLVPITLVKGSNQLLLKIQDIKGGWAFAARLLDKASLADQSIKAATNGQVEKIKSLTNAGADINAANENGMTPLAAAKVSGRAGIVDMLLKNGAKDVPVPSSEKITDSYYNSLTAKHAPGVAVLVARDGEILYRKGFGYADIENKVLATPDTKFRVGSVTKQFTAAAILKLQENGLISVNDKLSKFIPDFPRGDEVTIYMLLTHTSGIHSFTNNPDFLSKVTKPITPDSMVNAIKRDPYDFNPGEKMLYNNSGYFLLGYIISKISGKPYDVFLKENFFEPLHMNNTGIYYTGIKLENEAKGYGGVNGAYKPALNWDMSWAGGAGAIYSTVDDLLKWNQALYGGKVVTQKSLDAALTPAVLKNGEEPSMRYGFGLGLVKYRGMDVISHSGGLQGFLTQLSYYPKEKMTVVMFTNTSEPEVNFSPEKIGEAFLWDKMDKQTSYTETSVNPADLQKYTGRYELINVGVFTITTEKEKIYAQLSGQPKFEIFPMAEDEFFFKVVEARLKFQKDEHGEVNSVTLFQNGQEMKAKKLEDVATVTVDPSIFDQYTGKYKLNDNTIVTIMKENNKLFAWPSGESKLEMLPVSETDFVIKELNARLSFVKDENGKVKKIKLKMNGNDSELPRLE